MPEPHSYLVGLIGEGITTSLTPPMHEAEAQALGIRYVYRTLDLRALGELAEGVGELVAQARRLGFDALNITHPCKQLVIPYLDELSPEAERIGAVNTVLFEQDGPRGYNTDYSGFRAAYRGPFGDAAPGPVCMIGAGGVGKAVAFGLLDLGSLFCRHGQLGNKIPWVLLVRRLGDLGTFRDRREFSVDDRDAIHPER